VHHPQIVECRLRFGESLCPEFYSFYFSHHHLSSFGIIPKSRLLGDFFEFFYLFFFSGDVKGTSSEHLSGG
jgi:hypothetical protein